MFDALTKTVSDFVPNVPWLVVSAATGLTACYIHKGGFSVDGYIEALVVVLVASITTALWAGAIENGLD